MIDSDGDRSEADWSITVQKPDYTGTTQVPEILTRPLLIGGTEGAHEILAPDGYEIINVYNAAHGRVFPEGGKWFYEASGDNPGSFTVWFERLADHADFQVRVPVLAESSPAAESSCLFFPSDDTAENLAGLLGDAGKYENDGALFADYGFELNGALYLETQEMEHAMCQIENPCY